MDKIRFDQYVPPCLNMTKYHYCETRYIINNTVKKMLLVEYKFQITPALNSIQNLSKLAVNEINRHYNVNFSFDHVSFNGTNIIEIYAILHQSPAASRKSSGYSSTSSSAPKPNDFISWRKVECEPPIRRSGELEVTTFNASPVIVPIVRTSSSSQTEAPTQQPTVIDDSSSENTNPPPASQVTSAPNSRPFDYSSVEYNENIFFSRLSNNVAFSRARDVLSYFEDHRTSTYQGETYLSTINQLANDGIAIAPTDLRKVYYSLLKTRGFTVPQIEADLKSRRNYILTDAVMRAERAETVFHKRYTSGKEYTIGRCDPELCTIT